MSLMFVATHRLKSLCDEGQVEMMNEQIKALHNKVQKEILQIFF